jgi:multimeric flavodoxin WrbA
MNKKRVILYAVLITGFNLLLLQAITKIWPGQEMSAQAKIMMDQMMKYGTPGKEHELLKKYVGAWDVSISTWKDAMSKPETSKGTMKSMLILGGLYVKCEFQGMMMGGQNTQGLEIIGYDLFKKMYTTFWIDNMSSEFMITTGMMDMAGQVLTETGEYPDAMNDGKTMRKFRNVTTFLADGKYKFEMFMAMPDGKEMKSMELVFTRKGMMM